MPDIEKCVLVIAPHTSNWDFPIGVTFALDYYLVPTWMGKDALFKNGLGPISRWLGGMAVDRSKSNNLVEGAAAMFNGPGKLWLTITPEGTRSKVKKWKSGFYYIALAANVPIAMAFLDYRTKTCGVGKVMTPSGDYEADLKEIHAFYAQFDGNRDELKTLPIDGAEY